jgi:hypothetical protein
VIPGICLPFSLLGVFAAFAALSTNSHAATTVFSTGFEYAGGAPAVGTDAANLNGADGQIGAFSGTIQDIMSFTGANGGALLADGNSGAPGAAATSDWMFTANLTDTIFLAGTTLSFDYGTRRSAGNHQKDSNIVGFDSSNTEVFRLRVSAVSATGGIAGERLRVGYVDGASAVTWDLPGASDADNDLPFTATGPNGTISLSLTATGFMASLSGGLNSYTTSEIAFNGGSNLAYLQFEGQGGGNNNLRSGYYLDDITVTGTVVPEPSSALLLPLGAFGVVVRRRR